MTIRQGQVWQSKFNTAKYQLIQVEREIDGNILNIVMKNINSGVIFDIGDWELRQSYELVDSISKAKRRG